ncbi:XRE family transcriptional regulator [Arthrobacter sp. AK04]|uniref:ImmA/IrrE family metallo-endopeptidase n=1 Tax=Arthrobacter sp. AK04 TaxID=2900048 RepID=UPI001E419D72|nr:XRE family transcriptional regulator [Arthrobacter sp. AK04]MCD5343250.1 XRE family transcriptional regulator [Arthrobacter sp. AK04]
MTKQLTLFSTEELMSTQAVRDYFDPARLTQARRLAGITKQALGEAVGVSGAAIGQYEAGVTPRPEILGLLAKELGQPVAFFAMGRPIGKLDVSQAHFRSLRSTRASERLKATSFVEQVWEVTFALEKRVAFPDVNVPFNEADSSMSAVEAARALRAYWEVPSGPVPNLVELMERNGIVVSVLTLRGDEDETARVDAFSTAALNRPIVVVTPERARSVYRHRFTCAHELGHLILHRELAVGDPRQEREADAFAAEFLMPRAEIEPVLPATMNLPRLGQISQTWGVSPEALVFRMQELKGASDVSVRRGYQKLRSGNRQEASVADYPGEVPMLLTEAMKVADKFGFSVADLANELRWAPERVRQVLGLVDERPRLTLVR